MKKYSKLIFTVLGGKFEFPAQDSDLEYLSWRCDNSPVSSDLEPPLEQTATYISLALDIVQTS